MDNACHTQEAINSLFQMYNSIVLCTLERGKDSFGTYVVKQDNINNNVLSYVKDAKFSTEQLRHLFGNELPLIGITNLRAEPTTEVVKERIPLTIQPFEINNYVIAHNGIISNDISILSGGLVQSYLEKQDFNDKIVDSYAILELALKHNYYELLYRIEGSFAFSLLYPDGTMLLARNYRDLAIKIIKIDKMEVLFFSSKPEYLKSLCSTEFDTPVSIDPYSYVLIKPNGKKRAIIKAGRISFDDGEIGKQNKAIVICSGGLDSTTVATIACKHVKELTLMYFKYGCKAEAREMEAVVNITMYLRDMFPKIKIQLKSIDLKWLKELGGSTITDEDRYDQIATKDAGVETHNEWVPARNTVMIAMVAAYCDRYRIGRIYLGLNIEESGAFPDNTTEFYERFNDVLQVGTTSRPEIINPLGNLVKHEIYKKALEIMAPIHLSWSCYHNGPKHCGTCGPCSMRRIAAEINTVRDNIEYIT